MDRMKRMSMRQFGRIVARVMESLPPEFGPYLDNIVIDVEEEADEETLRELGYTEEEIDDGETVYGLFRPIMPCDSELVGADQDNPPRRVIIYKLPLEEDFPDPDELRDEIRKTVIHELAHHFGYSDNDIARWTSVY